MKVLLTTLNSKFSHSSLALRYLKRYCEGEENTLLMEEYTINESLAEITADIYKKYVDVVVFSCYIWNIREILSIADRLRKVKNDVIIILGGPEVSYDSINILKNNPFVDYVIRGEGEETLKELLDFLKNTEKNGLSPLTIQGIAFRNQYQEIAENPDRPLICELDRIPFPYNEADLKKISGRIIYYETSRGCPFNCSYCLSSTVHGTRYLPIERVKRELEFFIKNGVELVKFVDRTFNADKKRTKEIFKFIIENRGNTKFHFEISADLLDDDIIKYLECVPEGLFQFEIGVQSTNKVVLEAVSRKSNLYRLKTNVKRLRSYDNIHLHLDLIAGLPNENLSSFSASFDEVMYLRPHVLQLGFLKLLKGSKIRQRANDYQYKFISEPPYEILENSDLTYDEIVLLKSVEDVLEKYYNSGAFIKTLEFVLSSLYSSCFDFFRDLALYFNKYGLNRRSHSQKALYDILYEFYRANKERMRHSGGSSLDVENRLFREYLKFDFVNNQPGSFLPYWSNHTSDKGFREACFEFLKNRESIGKYLPYHIDESAKKLIKKVDFAIFNFGKNVDCFQVFLFDRISKKAYEVTQDWNGSVHSN